MKKIFLMMAFVAISFVASAQNSRFDVKIGYGWANLYGDDSKVAESIFSWKIGAGYEFRLGKLIGIEPSLMVDSKGARRYDLRYLNIILIIVLVAILVMNFFILLFMMITHGKVLKSMCSTLKCQ